MSNLARPPLAHDRLAQLPDGRLSLSLETPWSDGTEAIVLSPMDLIARLCALVPPPRMHMTRFFGTIDGKDATPWGEVQPPAAATCKSLCDRDRRLVILVALFGLLLLFMIFVALWRRRT